jgi:hypothetical protein
MEHSYLIARDRAEQEAALSAALSRVQQQLCTMAPVPCTLAHVLRAAESAWKAGFCYSLTYWPGEIHVTLRHGAAEIMSRATADDQTNIPAVAARHLAGLLGIVIDAAAPPAAAPAAPQPAACPAPQPAPAAPQPAAPPAPEPAPAAAEEKPLSQAEIDAAVSMIRCMAPDIRRQFSSAFRTTFAVPAEAKQITPYINTRSHLLFIDRFTVEAAGGIAAA